MLPETSTALSAAGRLKTSSPRPEKIGFVSKILTMDPGAALGTEPFKEGLNKELATGYPPLSLGSQRHCRSSGLVIGVASAVSATIGGQARQTRDYNSAVDAGAL
jgi:hypothetical protein